ncbi:helix-turn-helix domain-containing protein [Actinoplanes sp. M2I2]|uniref:helix-turn-helix domain-containing protein n=1 Tax=Actinoplanes sp. M2I2 TaxID=1734444 RepID=UPI00201FE6EB|nr:helix-turn-helix domain-containing protein [Actinoplanes sp. M2I2]
MTGSRLTVVARLTCVSYALALTGAAQRLVDEHLEHRTLTPEQVAQALNISTRTLYRAFAVNGEPLMAYVRRRRLERALADLADPQRCLNVAEIAARWGFADSSHLARACRGKYGQTPTEYVRAQASAA